MSKGFILNKYSEKVGEFDNANFDSIGVWNLSHVRLNQDYVDIVKMSTKEPYLFLLVEEKGTGSFDVVDSLGVGLMFSDSESWCSTNDMIFKEACFIENKGNNYEN